MKHNQFFFKRHQSKEKSYVEALKDAGYVPSRQIRSTTRFAIMDHDVGPDGVGFRRELSTIRQYRIPLFMFPHAARPTVFWDGIYPTWPYTVATFVISEGHKEVMRRYGYPFPTEVSGWPYCDILPFRPTKPRNILFGPIHPNANGWLNEVDLDINRDAFRRLLSFCEKNGSDLTVRYIRDLGQNGLKEIDGVKFIQAQPDGTVGMIDEADLVVGHQTFAYLAVARGKPTLMMGEDIAPRSGNLPSNFTYVSNWDKYRDLVQYPLDLLRNDPDQIINRACESDEDIHKWRDDMIGQPFDPAHYVKRLEFYLPTAKRVYSSASNSTRNAAKTKPVDVSSINIVDSILLYCPLYPVDLNSVVRKIYPETKHSIENLKWNGKLDIVYGDDGLGPASSLQEKHERIMNKYNEARKLVLDGKYDALFTIEADMVVPEDALLKLSTVLADVVYGIYVSRHSLNWYANILIDGKRVKVNKDGNLRRWLWGKVVESAGVGMGCTLIHRHVLEKFDFHIDGGSGADSYFAVDCLKGGFAQAHDFRVICGHINGSEILWPSTEKSVRVEKR